jgi:GTP-binding protein
MFVDKAHIFIKAGDGGNGHVSFRHEKFVDRGGPDGGDGGDGGNVIFVANRNHNTLAQFRFQKRLIAQSGLDGGKQRRHGKKGEDLMVSVPVGTMLINGSNDVIADLTQDGTQVVVALGGKGGYGNAHFTSSTRQAPKIAEKGEPGQEFELDLELKLIADVGLVGLPNVGKSTLLAALSNAHPEINNYPFTTLTPNLGVVTMPDKTNLLFADIPGLIEGAAKGKGLGDDFLRHIERTHILIHIIDAVQNNVIRAYQTIQDELKVYKTDLTKRPQIIALNKTENMDKLTIDKIIKNIKSVCLPNTPIIAISAQSKIGLTILLRRISSMENRERINQIALEAKSQNELPVWRLPTDTNNWSVEHQGGGYKVNGNRIERFAARTDSNNPASLNRLKDIMNKMGILHELSRQGIKTGQPIFIGDITIRY